MNVVILVLILLLLIIIIITKTVITGCIFYSVIYNRFLDSSAASKCGRAGLLITYSTLAESPNRASSTVFLMR